MNGHVDASRRALLDVQIGNSPSEQPNSLTIWIDTGFDGFLVVSKSQIEQLGLKQHAATEALLADGSRVTLESYICYVNWMGQVVAAQVIANDGKLPLLGTELLAGYKLIVDYVGGTVSVS